ncbi:MAG: RNA polymerase sigma factor [Armatimonadota bacterium]|nr:MAG: RNA polymerase sigma factor [Armatimonadota bacterium]
MGTAAARERGLATAKAQEEQLAQRLRNADHAAFGELWELFGPRLVAYAATRLGGDRELAEDVTAQSLAAAVASVNSFNPRRAGFSTWIYGIARRVIQGELRKQRRRRSVPPSAEVSLEANRHLVVGSDLQSDLPSRVEAQRKVQLLVSTLSPAEMEVLVLHFVDEFSVREIALIVGRSWRATDSLLHRAKEKARERLASDDQ